MSTEYLRDRLLTLHITNKLTANNVQLHDVRDMATVVRNRRTLIHSLVQLHTMVFTYTRPIFHSQPHILSAP